MPLFKFYDPRITCLPPNWERELYEMFTPTVNVSVKNQQIEWDGPGLTDHKRGVKVWTEEMRILFGERMVSARIKRKAEREAYVE
jgi:hypothetical protein